MDAEGRNVFDGGAEAASAQLRHAIGGVLDCLPEAMGLLVPNPNGFRRFQPDIFVPITRSWGFENRSVALRIPGGDGADANPYLALASLLAGIHHGLVEGIEPSPPATGNAGSAYDAGLPLRPRRALEALAAAQVLPGYLGADYVPVYVACKQAELDRFESVITPNEYAWYLQAD